MAATMMARNLHNMLFRHIWLVQAFGSHMTYGRAKARYDDHSLAVFEMAGLDAAAAEQAAATIFILVLGHSLGHAAATSIARKIRHEGSSAEDKMRRGMERARATAAGFSRLRARLDGAAAGYAAAPAGSFEFGLTAILDGLAAYLASNPDHQIEG